MLDSNGGAANDGRYDGKALEAIGTAREHSVLNDLSSLVVVRALNPHGLSSSKMALITSACVPAAICIRLDFVRGRAAYSCQLAVVATARRELRGSQGEGDEGEGGTSEGAAAAGADRRPGRGELRPVHGRPTGQDGGGADDKLHSTSKHNHGPCSPGGFMLYRLEVFGRRVTGASIWLGWGWGWGWAGISLLVRLRGILGVLAGLTLRPLFPWGSASLA